jgi:hypothetical protein
VTRLAASHKATAVQRRTFSGPSLPPRWLRASGLERTAGGHTHLLRPSLVRGGVWAGWRHGYSTGGVPPATVRQLHSLDTPPCPSALRHTQVSGYARFVCTESFALRSEQDEKTAGELRWEHVREYAGEWRGR